MHGVVSLLDDEHYALVEHLWDELEIRDWRLEIGLWK